MGNLDKALEFIEKGLKINPKFNNFSIYLAASYALLGQGNEAKKALENYLTRWPKGYHPSIQGIYFMWPFKNVDVFNRLAEGMVKAGLRGDPSDYYKVVAENKLTIKEIREITWGHTTSGTFPGGEWWTKWDNEGNFNFRMIYTNRDGTKGEYSDNGRSWPEGDMGCYLVLRIGVGKHPEQDNHHKHSNGIKLRYCLPTISNHNRWGDKLGQCGTGITGPEDPHGKALVLPGEPA